MRKFLIQSCFALPLCLSSMSAAQSLSASKEDTTPHHVQMITVAPNVRLEVLDWGGTGRPVVLLAGLGDDAHVFDAFAPKLTSVYHVYGITRRGFGVSSAPKPDLTNYAVTRLGEDVFAVISSLKLVRPVIAGHSIAGQELSYLSEHHSDKIGGLIYLDAEYSYALYDKVNGSLHTDAFELRDQLGAFVGDAFGDDPLKFLDHVSELLHRVDREVLQQRNDLVDMLPLAPDRKPASDMVLAIVAGRGRFTTLKVPALLIVADPHDFGDSLKENPKARASMEATDLRFTEWQLKAFERQVPSAHIVRIPNADHYLFRSNEIDVIREMNTFMNNLPGN